MQRPRRDTEGVTPILGTMMLLVIILTMVATVLYWGSPTINGMEMETQLTSGQGYFENANKEIKGLLHDGWGSGRTMKISIPSGGIQMYRDDTPFIDNDEMEVRSGFQQKTVWVLSYNMPASKYDILFDGIIDHFSDKFTIRSIGDTAPTSCKISVECLQGEKAGEVESKSNVTITPKAEISIKLYDQSRITVATESPVQVIAQAYVFALGPISYFLPTDKGTFHLILQNSGLSSDYPDSKSIVDDLLMSESSVSSSAKTLTLYMADFNPTGIYSTESGDFSLGIRYGHTGYYCGEQVRNLRISISGDYSDAWGTSLTGKYLRSHATSQSVYTGFLDDDSQHQVKDVIYNTPTSLYSGGRNLVQLNIIWAGLDVEVRS